MTKDLISVVVPVYKVENYLNECIDNIIAQTYNNLEIILVDDGSPDNCGNICDEYAKTDLRIKVIHKENGGLSSARNAGLDIANGEYIGFVDSDDYPENNMFEELYKSIIEFDSDMSVCGVKKFGLESRTEFYGKKCLRQSDYLKELLSENVKSYTWNKLYKKKLFSSIRFPVGELFEDIKIMHLIGEETSKVSFTDSTFYNYRIRQNSITYDNKGLKASDYLSATHNRTVRYENTDLYIYAAVGEFRCLRVIVSDMSMSNSKSGIYKQFYKESKKLYKICKKKVKGFQKLLSSIYLVSPKLFFALKRLFMNNYYGEKE